MTPAQRQLYFCTWQSAAKAHGWNCKASIAAAVSAHHTGHVWESPALNDTLSQIYSIAEFAAHRAGREDLRPDDLRHAITTFALGRDASSTSFSNADFDRVLALLRLLADASNLKNLLASDNADESGARRRQLHFIGTCAPAYVAALARDKFGCPDPERLTLAQLRQLSLTLRNRPAAHTQPATDLQPA